MMPFLTQSPLLIGGELVYAVLDANSHVPNYPATPILSNGGLTYTQALNTYASAVATFGLNSGKRYFEVTRDNAGHSSDSTIFGVAEEDGTLIVHVRNNTALNYRGYVNDGSDTVNYGGSYGAGSVFGFLLDLDTDEVTGEVNGNVIFTRTMGAHGTLFPFICLGANSTRAVSVQTFNFGQTPWAYAPGGGWFGWSKEI